MTWTHWKIPTSSLFTHTYLQVPLWPTVIQSQFQFSLVIVNPLIIHRYILCGFFHSNWKATKCINVVNQFISKWDLTKCSHCEKNWHWTFSISVLPQGSLLKSCFFTVGTGRYRSGMSANMFVTQVLLCWWWIPYVLHAHCIVVEVFVMGGRLFIQYSFLCII